MHPLKFFEERRSRHLGTESGLYRATDNLQGDECAHDDGQTHIRGASDASDDDKTMCLMTMPERDAVVRGKRSSQHHPLSSTSSTSFEQEAVGKQLCLCLSCKFHE